MTQSTSLPVAQSQAVRSDAERLAFMAGIGFSAREILRLLFERAPSAQPRDGKGSILPR